MPLKSCKHQCQSQWAMYKKIPVTFHVLRIRLIEMDQVGIESKRGKSEEQGFVGFYLMKKFGVRGSFSRIEMSAFVFPVDMDRICARLTFLVFILKCSLS